MDKGRENSHFAGEFVHFELPRFQMSTGAAGFFLDSRRHCGKMDRPFDSPWRKEVNHREAPVPRAGSRKRRWTEGREALIIGDCRRAFEHSIQAGGRR
jgi:hypothetical protein